MQPTTGRRLPRLLALTALLLAVMPLSAFAQGSIFGSVTNSDASTPANGEISFFGFLDDTDEELRIETSTGAGYDAGNWFDDFQNYLTEAPGNPYDYYFYNTANGEGFHLADLIPNNSFQQEDILLAPVAWPAQPAGVTGAALSSGSVLLEWNSAPGVTYHIYRRAALSNGSFFRLDNTAGDIGDAGVADSFFVDNTTDGASSYEYLVIAEDGSGNYSQHSDVVTVNSATNANPVVTAISPDSGLTLGGQAVTITGSGFDPAGVTGDIGGFALTDITVVSPYELSATTGAGTAGTVDVTVTNTASGLSGTLPGSFTYVQNSIPVLAAIGAQAVTEGNLLAITSSATDADGDIPVMSTSTLPSGATFADNGDGTGTFNWTPGFLESGTYNVTFYATDAVEPTLIDSEQVVITVNDAGNQLPVLAAIGDQSTTENVNLSFGVSATDVESTPVLTTSALPGTATFVDNGDGSGSFSWTPDFTEAGTYPITFYATDDSTAVDSELVTITVTDAGNQAPVLATIGSQSTTENVQLLFAVSASDADGTIPTLSTSVLPGTATFVDNGDGTGAFDWTPDFTDAGTYDITFYATDGFATDSEVVAITVTDAGNQPPVLDPIGAQATTENVQLLFAVTASDADGEIPTLSATGLPAGALFTDNGDGTGSFDWTPTFTDAGIYNVTFSATDGVATDSEVVEVTVVDAGNQAPVLDPIGPQAGTEDVQLLFAVTASDADGEIPVLSATGLPAGALFTDNGDGTGSFDWTPDFTQAGSYDVTFFADDLVATDSEVVTITIADAGNQSPVLDPIGPQATSEEVQLLFNVSASDADGTIPTLSATGVPTGAVFTDNLDGTGTFDWTPAPATAGTYDVTFYAADGLVTDSEVVTITVVDVNQAPVLAAIGPQVTDENLQLLFAVSASDADGDIPVLSTSALPAGATFVDNLDGTGSFDWTPTFTDSGTYSVTFYATDAAVSSAIDSEVVSITVNNVNQLPELTPIGTQSINEGGTLTFTTSATDLDGDTPILTASTLPGTATYVDSGNGTGYFNWATTFADAGTYSVTFYAADSAFPAAIDSEVVTILVGEVGNQPPQWTEINDTTVNEGATLVLNVAATDFEGNAISLAINTPISSNLYTFVDNGDGTGVFTYTPDYESAGLDSVRFIASDDATPPLSSIMKVGIVVNDQNQAPQFVTAGPFVVDAQDSLIFTVEAYDSSDVDGGRLYLSASDVPTNGTFTDNADNTGTFRFAPALSQVGVDTVHFMATDDDTPALTGHLYVQITVRDVNQVPVLDPIGPRQVTEGATLTINLSASDPDGTIPSFVVKNAPATSSLSDNGDGTAVWTYTPTFVESGLKYVEFRATDGQNFDKETVAIQVIEAGDQAPYFFDLPSPSVTEGDTLVDSVTAFDPDFDEMFLSVDSSQLPPNFTFADSGDGVGYFEFTPDFTQSGTVVVGVVVEANGAFDTSTFTIDVIEFGNHPPVLDPIADASTTELDTVSFAVSASDIDGVDPILSASPLPGSATFSDNGGGNGFFRWIPTDTDAGDYTIWFFAQDGDPAFSSEIDSQAVLISVADTNRVPVYSAFIPPETSQNEGDTIQETVTVRDPDGVVPEVSVFLDGTDTMATNMTMEIVSVVADTVVATMTWVFDYTQGNDDPTIYYYRWRFTDGADSTLSVQSSTRQIQVDDVPQPPTMTFSAGAGPFTMVEGDSLGFRVSAVDPDAAGIPGVRAENLPANATTSAGFGALNFSFEPDFTQAGTYTVRFIAEDGGGTILADTQDVQITVTDAGNQAPYFTSTHPDTQSVYVGAVHTTTVTAFDPDADPLTLTAGPLSADDNFIDNGDGTGQYVLDADAGAINTFRDITFSVQDPSAAGESFVITYRILGFLRGDADSDERYSMNDIVYLANYLFRGGSEPAPMESGDVDLNGTVGVSDVVYMINFLYKSGPRPPQ